MLLFRDGFDKYAVSADMAMRWAFTTGSPTYLATGGVKARGGMQLGTSNTRVTAAVSGSSLTSGGTVHVAFWMKVIDAPSAPIEFFQINTNVGSDQARIGIQAIPSLPNGVFGIQFSATQQHGNLGAGTSLGPAYSAIVNQWHHVEYAAKYDNTTGFVKVWVDRDLIIDFSGDTLAGTQPSSLSSVTFVGGFNSYAVVFDDIVIWDESGSDFAPAQIGLNREHFIETLEPDGDDAVQFIPSSGSNFQNVDEAGYDGDTSYNSSNVVGDVDEFTVEDQAVTPLETHAICVGMIARFTIPGIVKMRSRMRSGAALVESGDTAALSGSYTHYWHNDVQLGLDPDTGVAWTTTAVNSLKIGYKLQSVGS